MRFRITSIVGLIFPVLAALLLAGCLTGGGGGPTYDGTWTVSYVDSSFTPPTFLITSASGVSTTLPASCSVQNPLPTITLVNGTGSTTQTLNCTGSAANQNQNFIYLISVAITTSTSVVNAIVNGVPLTGQCISAFGCAAQSGTKSLSLSR